ncbi:MAG TPA: polysaccharide biosynthesis/export family protein [Vicinamibacterales bacterium]|nr:polysaccharide biosynthesis/export family protein [Vicinamibacterales bacterium]
MKTILLSMVVLLAQAATPPLPQRNAEYVVGTQDVLSIVVHNQEEMTRRDGYPVEADGTIDFPLIGRITVAGLTTRQIQETIKEKLISGGFYTNVSLSVTVKEYRSQSVLVNGSVRTPGVVQLTGVGSLTEAISKAGHFTPDAGQHVIIVRGRGQDGPALLSEARPEDKIIVDRADIETGKASSILVRDGDTIFVPRAAEYYVSGQVRTPNAYIYKPNLTVIQAITIAGGYTDRAAKNRIQIERVIDGRPKKLKVKESDFVQPGDTIHVPARWW